MTPPLTCPDVAKMLGFSRQAIAEWARNGTLPAQRTSGGLWLFDPAVVAAFVPPEKRSRPAEGCAAGDCGGKHYALGYCKPHWRRLNDCGDVRADVPIGKRTPRSQAQVDLIDTDEL